MTLEIKHLQTSEAKIDLSHQKDYFAEWQMAELKVSKAEKEARHDKHKRCLAMAEFCESQHDFCNTLANGFWLVRGDKEARDKYRKKATDFWWKWHKRWLELAEKFKPNI